MPEQAVGRPDKGRLDLPLLIAALLIPAVLGSSQTLFNDGDVSWHIATGQWMLDHRAIPHTDPFSFTWLGRPWVPIEWLAELFYGAAYRMDGYSGVAALATAALVALHAIVYLNTRGWAGFAAVVAMDAVLIPMMLARPHLLAWPLMALWIWLMLRARERDRAPPLPAALLIAVWANLHGSFVIGLAIASMFGLEALIATPDRARALRQWGLFGLCCAIAVFINGNGLAGVLQPLEFTKLKMLPLIAEWKPSSPATTPFFFAVLAVTLALIALKRPRLHPVRWALLGALLVLALLQVRHQAVLAIVSAMILAPAVSRTARKAVRRAELSLIGAGAAFFVVVRAIMPLSPPENDANPWKLIAAVPPPLRSQPVLNGYSMGGPLILSGIRPYIDGRGDMYGDELVIGYAGIVHGDAAAFQAAVDRWNIRWAIVPNDGVKLVSMIENTAGWRRVARDRVGTIYVRD